MQKVLFFTDRIFWPANDGHKVVLSNYCKGLAERYGCEIHVLSFLETGQSEDLLRTKPAYISSVQLAEKPSKTTIAINLSVSLLKGKKGGPIQGALFKSGDAMRQLRDAVSELIPDYCFIDLPRLASFVECIDDLPCKKVLYMEDAFSARYDRQLKCIDILKKTGGVAGKYSANFSGGMTKLASNRFLQKAVLATESKRMKLLEQNAPATFDYVVLVSPVEAKKLAEGTFANNVVAIPLGVDCSYYMSGPHPVARRNVVSFLGDMRASANADSLRYIVGEVLPLLDNDVVLEVSGTAPKELLEEFVDNDRVKFLGRVEDTRETLRSSAVFLAPIAYGTGIKTKILEAMAIGMPIVTNSVGNEGIGLVDGEDALISNTAIELANDVALLINNVEKSSSLAKAAQKKAACSFDWKTSLSYFSRLGFVEEKAQETRAGNGENTTR